MAKKKVTVSVIGLKTVLKTWIDEASISTIARIFNDNFDTTVEYEPNLQSFLMDKSDADDLGLL